MPFPRWEICLCFSHFHRNCLFNKLETTGAGTVLEVFVIDAAQGNRHPCCDYTTIPSVNTLTKANLYCILTGRDYFSLEVQMRGKQLSQAAWPEIAASDCESGRTAPICWQNFRAFCTLGKGRLAKFAGLPVSRSPERKEEEATRTRGEQH